MVAGEHRRSVLDAENAATRVTEASDPTTIPRLSMTALRSRLTRDGPLKIDVPEVGKVFGGKLALSECINDAGKAVPCCKGQGEICTVNVAVVQLF